MIHLHSQPVAIELSIEWKKETIEISDMLSLKCVPYLKITYNNLSDSSLYFLRMHGTDIEAPMFAGSALMNGSRNIDSLISINEEFGYSVLIGEDVSFKTQVWSVISDTLDTFIEQPIDLVNDDLSIIYDYLFYNKSKSDSKNGNLSVHYLVEDLSSNRIENNLENKFIFLKPNQKQSFLCNLTGFQLLGGRYSFEIGKKSIADFVYITPIWSDELEKWIFKKQLLPDNVNNHYLYKGSFHTNKVEVFFENVK